MRLRPIAAAAAAVPARALAGDLGTTVVEVAVPMIVFFTAISIVGAVLFANYRNNRLKQETLRLAIDKGAQVPVELLHPAPRPGEDLRRGIKLIFLGVGLAILLAFVADHPGVWAVGALPALTGVGYVVAWAVQRRLEGPPERLAS